MTELPAWIPALPPAFAAIGAITAVRRGLTPALAWVGMAAAVAAALLASVALNAGAARSEISLSWLNCGPLQASLAIRTDGPAAVLATIASFGALLSLLAEREGRRREGADGDRLDRVRWRILALAVALALAFVDGGLPLATLAFLWTFVDALALGAGPSRGTWWGLAALGAGIALLAATSAAMIANPEARVVAGTLWVLGVVLVLGGVAPMRKTPLPVWLWRAPVAGALVAFLSVRGFADYLEPIALDPNAPAWTGATLLAAGISLAIAGRSLRASPVVPSKPTIAIDADRAQRLLAMICLCALLVIALVWQARASLGG